MPFDVTLKIFILYFIHYDVLPQLKLGITLDLGFSSFLVDLPAHLQTPDHSYSKLQFTLVDCPGHASLIRTIIGGAQLIDMMLLVIDINKGIQTQTAECVVIGEITTNKLIIVLNKIDLIPQDQRENKIIKVKNRLKKMFSTTKFANAPMLCVSAAVGGIIVLILEHIFKDTTGNYI